MAAAMRWVDWELVDAIGVGAFWVAIGAALLLFAMAVGRFLKATAEVQAQPTPEVAKDYWATELAEPQRPAIAAEPYYPPPSMVRRFVVDNDDMPTEVIQPAGELTGPISADELFWEPPSTVYRGGDYVKPGTT